MRCSVAGGGGIYGWRRCTYSKRSCKADGLNEMNTCKAIAELIATCTQAATETASVGALPSSMPYLAWTPCISKAKRHDPHDSCNACICRSHAVYLKPAGTNMLGWLALPPCRLVCQASRQALPHTAIAYAASSPPVGSDSTINAPRRLSAVSATPPTAVSPRGLLLHKRVWPDTTT